MAAAGVPVLPGAEVTSARRTPSRPPSGSVGPYWSRPPSVVAAGECGSSTIRANWATPSNRPGGRRRRRSATPRCSSSGSCNPRATSRSRSSATGTGRSSTCSNASARSNGGTRRSSRKSPSPAVDAHRRAALGQAAVAAARALGYVGAGTVEFVMDGAGQFFFLEVNTRLQVEHPVTEEVTGLDLVALQLQVAARRAAPACGARRRDPRATPSRPGCTQRTSPPGFSRPPAAWNASTCRPDRAIRVDSGVADGSVVSPYYDAMLAKVIAWAPTRTDAAGRLADALQRSPGARRRHQPRPARRGSPPPRVPGRADRHRLPRTSPAGGAERRARCHRPATVHAVAAALGRGPAAGPRTHALRPPLGLAQRGPGLAARRVGGRRGAESRCATDSIGARCRSRSTPKRWATWWSAPRLPVSST